MYVILIGLYSYTDTLPAGYGGAHSGYFTSSIRFNPYGTSIYLEREYSPQLNHNTVAEEMWMSPIRNVPEEKMSSSTDSPPDEDTEYVVEEVLDIDIEDGKWIYYLKWEGYEEATWEWEKPGDNFSELIDEYIDINETVIAEDDEYVPYVDC